LLQNERILEGMPDGLVLLDAENTILWANEQVRQWAQREDVAGENFYACLGSPEILGPDFCPFHTALATGQASSSMLRAEDNRYFQIHAAPIHENGGTAQHLIVSVRDETAEMLQQQKLTAIHRAGVGLADLTPDEVYNMEVDERIELLKSNILHYAQDLFKFDVVEIRLLDESTGELATLLSVGIDSEASRRKLYARPQNNGVTGFVAATGKSYLCEDTLEDPLYIEGFKGAKSSLTVPLILHDQVIGTFNVESPKPRGFTESDLQFLEIFSRDVAVSLNTLELLVAQKANTAQQSVEAIHSAVALPVDEILNDAVNVMEHYIGHEPQVVERLQRILRNARDIKQVIQRVGRRMAPSKAVPSAGQVNERPRLRDRRVLVVDANEGVRNDAHALLERYGCVVETAHEGGEAVFMVRNSLPDAGYDVIIADVRLPDMTGHDLLLKLQQIIDPVPLVLMTGFGYDPSHSIVKARQSGLHPKAVLYKPFRLDQLLETVEGVMDVVGRVTHT
jgi:CheY-like chemotaxis protein